MLLDELLDHDSCNSSTTCSASGQIRKNSSPYASALAQNVICKLLCLSQASSSEVLARFGGRLSLHFAATSDE